MEMMKRFKAKIGDLRIVKKLKGHPMPLTLCANIVVPLLFITAIVLASTLSKKYSVVDQKPFIKSGYVMSYDYMYLLSAYISIGLLSSYSFACKILARAEMSNIQNDRYHTREDIYAFSKAMHAFVYNPFMTIGSLFDKRITKRSRKWIIVYSCCVALSVFSSLATTALPQLLEHDITYLEFTDIKSQITSDVLTNRLANLTAKGNLDDVVFMARQVNDGKYLWEKIDSDKYDPKGRIYYYSSDWGHASADGTTDKKYPRPTPMPGKTNRVLKLDGFSTVINCYITDCEDCGATNDSDSPTPNRMGITKITLENDNRVQYQLFWGSGSKNSSGIGVVDADTAGMVKEASFHRKSDAEDSYNYSLLSPGGIKVNCDYTVLNKVGKAGSEPLVVTNPDFFRHSPFADPLSSQAPSDTTTLDPGTLNSLLSEENILRNLTYNIHNSFRLLNDKLFRTKGYQSDVNGWVEWRIDSNKSGYDFFVFLIPTMFLGITVFLYICDLVTMYKGRLMPLSYAIDVDTRLSVMALADIPQSNEYEKLARYTLGSEKDFIAEAFQEVEYHQKEDAHRDEIKYRWHKGIFVPHYDGVECKACANSTSHDEVANEDNDLGSLNSTQIAYLEALAKSDVSISENNGVSDGDEGQATNENERDGGNGQRDNNTARSSFTTISTNSFSENQVRDIEQGRAEDMIYSQPPIPSLHRVMTPSNIPPALLEFYNATHAQNSSGNSGSGNGHKRNPSLPQTPPTLQGAGGNSTRRDSDDNRSTRSQSFDESRQENVPPRK